MPRSFPSEQEFVPNSVAFCCPHCDQAYYGTTDNGHLVPPEFDCVRCGRHVHMDEMILRPAEGVAEAQTKPDVQPWLDRRSIGLFRSTFRTIGMALVSPGALLRATPLESSHGAAWGFAGMAHLLIVSVVVIPLVLLSVGLVAAGAGGGGGAIMGVIAALVGSVIGVFVFVMLLILIWGLIAHGLLRLTGSLDAGIGRTWTALCYSSGANVLSAVPCIGQYIGWIWWVVSACVAMKEAHRVSGGRAVVAVAVPPLLLIGSLIGLYAWAIVMAISAANVVQMNTAAVNVAAGNGVTLGQALASWPAPGPRHPLELIDDVLIDDRTFIDVSSMTTTLDVPIGGGHMLSDFTLMPPGERETLLGLIVESVPEDVVAMRFGDVVFTHYGIDPLSDPSGLWLAVLTPDPARNPPGTRPQIVTVVNADGTTTGIPVVGFETALIGQNAMRAAAGLEPIPNPRELRHTPPPASNP